MKPIISKILQSVLFMMIALPPVVCGHGPFSLPESDKRFIWRIENPENRLGTGFVISDSTAGYLLITNKHVVWSDSLNDYFDSVQVHVNILTENNKVKSIDSTLTLYLRVNGVKLFREHKNSNVDLIAIRLGRIGEPGDYISNPSDIDWYLGFSSTLIANTETAIINDGAIVQMIGYSLRFAQSHQYPTSRYGFVSHYAAEDVKVKINNRYYTSKWIFVDGTVRGGHSGGPVFISNSESKRIHMIGFLQATVVKSEIAFVIPSHFILEVIEDLRIEIEN